MISREPVRSPRNSAEKVRHHNRENIPTNLTTLSLYVALKTLSNSEFHYEKAKETNIPNKVDLFTFMKVCDEVLGIKAK